MAYSERRARPYTVALFSDDKHYFGRITCDSVNQRNAERDELNQQWDEPGRGGLTADEEKRCREAFVRLQTLPKGYEAVWKDKKKRLEAHVIMHTARARAFEAQDPAVLKAKWEQEHAETTDGSIRGPDSPSHAPMHGAGATNLQPHTTETATAPEANPSAAEGDHLIADQKKGCREVAAQSSGSGRQLHRGFPSMTGSKGSRTVIDLTDTGNDSEGLGAARSVETMFKKRVEAQTKHKPTPTNTASPFALKPQRLEAPPTKRQNADGVKGGEKKRHKRGVTGPPATVGPISRPSQGSKPSLPTTRALHKPADGAASQLFEPVLGAGTSVIRESEEPEDRDESYRAFLEME